MAEDYNQVTVAFQNGDKLNVDIVARLVGADWLTAKIIHERDDPNDNTLDVENVILHTDDVRYIRSDKVTPAGETGTNFRVHHTRDLKENPSIITESWKGQHQLHPNDDPSAYPESEKRWPPHDSNGKHKGKDINQV